MAAALLPIYFRSFFAFSFAMEIEMNGEGFHFTNEKKKAAAMIYFADSGIFHLNF